MLSDNAGFSGIEDGLELFEAGQSQPVGLVNQSAVLKTEVFVSGRPA